MAKRHFILVPNTHVDLAWKRGPQEMTEMLEILVVRLLDALESDASFKYTVEQAAHYRTLAQHRPDLVERLGRYVREGRVEMAGCMASTLETNLPAGESFVRNQLLGIKWVRDVWQCAPRIGWLIDTFGINAQVPQILRQFGLKYLSANRLGGDKFNDVMISRGLDGSKVMVVGSDVYSSYMRPGHVVVNCYGNWDGLDKLFAHADALPGEGPFMVFAQTENEMLVSLRPLRDLRDRIATRPDERWEIGTPHDHFVALDQTARDWPEVDGDLNPEFTGCFSLRPRIRLRNRRAETLLLEAEKWAILAGTDGWSQSLEEAWWKMAFVQFHDVFTGSHPTAVYTHVMKTFDAIDAAATEVLESATDRLYSAGRVASSSAASSDVETVVAVNGLPWPRRQLVRLPLGDGAATITTLMNGDAAVPFDVRGNEAHALITMPACGASHFRIGRSSTLTSSPPADVTPADTLTLENEFITLELDTKIGLRQLTWKPTGRVLMQDAGDLLVVQRDDGNFQIEQPGAAEVVAAAGSLALRQLPGNATGSSAVLSGEFPPLSWAGPDSRLKWEIEFTLTTGRPAIDILLRFDWKGEASRIRLKLATTIESAGAVFEVPFGTVRREAYGTRGTSRGEWPAQRFVALQDATHGIALANNGAAGVELQGRRLITSLLRAPADKYAGMVPDESSSGHGQHAYAFTIVPYAGSWTDSPVVQIAQELNVPVRVAPSTASVGSSTSFLSIDSPHVVLSTLKRPEDGAANECIVRVFEIAGRAVDTTLRLAGMTHAWMSDLPEHRGEPLTTSDESVRLNLKPFEIQTIRVQRQPGKR